MTMIRKAGMPMIISIMLWNEPNNLSDWDFQMDPQWREFSTMVKHAAVEGPAALLHLWPAGPGGVCPLCRRGGQAVRAGLAASGSHRGREELL